MTSLTPDHIAQLASRLYSESPGGHGAGLAGGPVPPVDPSADSLAREQAQAPATPLPPETLPAFDSPIFQSQAPAAAPVASAAPVEAFRGPTEFGSQFGGHCAVVWLGVTTDYVRLFRAVGGRVADRRAARVRAKHSSLRLSLIDRGVPER